MHRSAFRLIAPLVALAALASGCAEPEGNGLGGVTSRVDTWTFYPPLNRAVDLLFVIDDSASMAGEQAALAAAVPDLITVLEQIEGGLPGLHIGVVSSDVGAAGQAGVPGCSGSGDDGALQTSNCAGLEDAFLSDVTDGREGRIRNYTGELRERFACMASLGTDGCEFEMPLESMFRALQPGKNPGFLRDDAYLAVMFVTDEDDCSSTSAALFGDPTAGLDSPLGPRTSFRCFEHGVECDDGLPPRAFGVHTGCRPRAASPYVADVDRYVSFLKGLKRDPSLVIVGGILGVDDERHTVVVGPGADNPAHPAVQPSCVPAGAPGADAGATPPIRLAHFLRQFINRNNITSICGATFQDALSNVASSNPIGFGRPCLRRPLADGDAALPGVQPQCSVRAVLDPAGQPSERLIPACAHPDDAVPCWELVPGPLECPDAPGNLYHRVVSDGVNPLRGVVRVQCVVD